MFSTLADMDLENDCFDFIGIAAKIVKSIAWGSVAEWIAALASLGALAGVAFTVWYAGRAARLAAEANGITSAAYERDVAERAIAQARLIYALTDPIRMVNPGEAVTSAKGQRAGADEGVFDRRSMRSGPSGHFTQTAQVRGYVAVIHVTNGSDEIIGPIALRLFDKRDGRDFGNIELVDDDPIFPRTVATFSIAVREGGSMAPLLRARLTFRDSNGRWWSRSDYDPVQPLADVPIHLRGPRFPRMPSAT